MNQDGIEFTAVSNVIRKRRTAKVLCEVDHAKLDPHTDAATIQNLVIQCIETAGAAPFHYDRGVDRVPEPWRFYFVDQKLCRRLANSIPGWFADIKPNNKLPSMLSACSCLVLVTWIPQFPGASDEKQILVDEEHLAATAAAVQNLLLLLTAAELQTYWSSGGFFRTEKMFSQLGIASQEKLLAAVFVNKVAIPSDYEVVDGKLNALRTSASSWSRKIELE